MSASIRGLKAHYIPTIPVLRSVSLEVRPGEVTTVLGESGSGKTTLLRVLAGLHPASAGEILLDGEDIVNVPVERRGVGLVPQESALFQHLTVAANIAYGLPGVGRRSAERHPRVRDMIALVGLEGLEARMPHELSGGQQQRVALARALAPRPRMLLLDEPFSALDPSLRMRVREEVFAILREQNLPTLLITHDQQEALSCSDHVAVLREGRVVQSGTPEEVYFSPVDAWVAAFVGDACILPASREGDRLRTPFGEMSAPAGREGRGRGRGRGHGQERVMVRPENLKVRLCASRDETEAMTDVESGTGECRQGAVYGRVERTRFLGHYRLVDIAVSDGGEERVLVARVDAYESPFPVGARVRVEVKGAVRLLPGE